MFLERSYRSVLGMYGSIIQRHAPVKLPGRISDTGAASLIICLSPRPSLWPVCAGYQGQFVFDLMN